MATNNVFDLNTGLVNYFPCGNIQGTTLEDIAGSNNGTATSLNESDVVDGYNQYRNSLKFDGANDLVNINGVLTSNLSTTTIGTWMMWVALTDTTPAAIEIPLSFNDTNANEFIHLRIKTDGKLLAKVMDAGVAQWQLETDSSPFSENLWTYIALVQDGTSPILYINALQVAQTFTTSTDKTKWFNDLTGLDNGRIADRNVDGGGEANHFDGVIEDVMIYSRNLSGLEIDLLYKNQLKGRRI